MIHEYFADKPSSSNKKITLLSGIALLVMSSYFLLSTPTPALASQLEFELQEFEYFLSLHDKQYEDPLEYSKRFHIFKDNLAYIRMFNSLQKDWTLGVTVFADLTSQEFKALHTLQVPQLSTEISDDVPDTVPSSVNWVTQGKVGPVINQGEIANVLAITVAASVSSTWAISGHTLIPLSYQELNDCVRPLTSFGDGYAFVVSNGLTSLANYPASSGTCNKAKVAQPVAKIRSYVNVNKNDPTALQTALSIGPVAVLVEADQSAFQLYQSGVITSNCGSNVDHSLLAVGYDLTAKIPYYLAQNSWGTSWGMSGYVQIGIASGAGICGIQTFPTYPVV